MNRQTHAAQAKDAREPVSESDGSRQRDHLREERVDASFTARKARAIVSCPAFFAASWAFAPEVMARSPDLSCFGSRRLAHRQANTPPLAAPVYRGPHRVMVHL